MSVDESMRPGETAVSMPSERDAELIFIGRLHTPWTERRDCPRQGREDGPECRVEVFEPWLAGLKGIGHSQRIDLLYWLNEARRDLVLQMPRGRESPLGTFAIRSPVRPNPIGLSRVRLIAVEPPFLRVVGLDCLDGTPLLDIKPGLASHVEA